jgi:hypothetical protein
MKITTNSLKNSNFASKIANGDIVSDGVWSAILIDRTQEQLSGLTK